MLISAGVDYKNTPLYLREKLSANDDRAKEIMTNICGLSGVKGCVILSTCNRSELYISADNEIDIVDIYVKYYNVNKADFCDKINVYKDSQVIYHIIETACGVNSAIKGESQIITQINQSADLSRGCNCIDSELDVLFRIAVSTGKKAVTNSADSFRLTSANKAVDKLINELGSLKDKKCVVIGNGKVGLLAARLLVKNGALVTITLRHYRHTENIVPYGCKCIDYDKRIDAINGCDILISATKSPHYTLTNTMCNNILLPKYIVDLAVPRDIEASVYENKNITYYNIDDFEVDSYIDNSVYEKIDDGVSEYMNWFNYRESIETIENIKDIIAKRISVSMGFDEDNVKPIASKTADMIFGAIKETITPEVIEECYNRIKDRARL